MGKRVALIIGINEYEDTTFNELKYAEIDARKIHEILIDPDICEFKEEDVTLLTGATKSAVEENLEGILNEATKDDFVFIYFAGHGKLDRSGSLCLAAKDTITNRLLSTSVNLEHIRRIIDQSDCKRIVFILDSCFSGAVGQSFRSGEFPSESIEQISGHGKVIISASQAYERARERDDLKHGIFTYNLVKCLEKGEADYDSDGYITIDDIYRYLYDNVKAESKGQQVPMKWGMDEKGEIVLAKSIKVLQKKKEEYERLSNNARELESKGKLDEALSIWNKIIELDIDSYKAEVIGKSEELKAIIANIDTLFEYYNKRGLPGSIYNEAVENLKKLPASLSEKDKSYRRLIEGLLSGYLSLEVFIESWRRVENLESQADLEKLHQGKGQQKDSAEILENEKTLNYQRSKHLEPSKEEQFSVSSQDAEAFEKGKASLSKRDRIKPKYMISAAALAVIVIAVFIFTTTNKETNDYTNTNGASTTKVAIQPPEVLSFKSKPSKIKSGELATLVWETSNATDVEIEGIGKLESSGEKVIKPKETTTYTLIAKNDQGEIVKSSPINIKVEVPPSSITIDYFRAANSTITKGESTTLKWDTSNADEVEINPIGEVPASGSIAVNPAETTSYKLIAKNQEEVANKMISVKVNPRILPPKINYFNADSKKLEKGSSTTLSWDTSNSNEIEIKPIGKVKESGTQTVLPPETTTYTLLARNKEGKTVEQELTIFVLEKPKEIQTKSVSPTINYFKTNENELEKGYPFILSWSTTNAEDVEISGIGQVSSSGYKSLKATETQTYTLTARNKDGRKVESNVTVKVVDKLEESGDQPKIKYEEEPVLPEVIRRHIYDDN